MKTIQYNFISTLKYHCLSWSPHSLKNKNWARILKQLVSTQTFSESVWARNRNTCMQSCKHWRNNSQDYGRVKDLLAASHLPHANAHMCTNNLKKNVITTSHIKHRQTPFSLLGLKQMMQYFCCDFSKMIRVPFYLGEVWCFKNIFPPLSEYLFF